MSDHTEDEKDDVIRAFGLCPDEVRSRLARVAREELNKIGPDPDVLGCLHERYGIEPEWGPEHPNQYVIRLPCVTYTLHKHKRDSHSGYVHGENGHARPADDPNHFKSLEDLCDAADDVARKMLDETADAFGGGADD